MSSLNDVNGRIEKLKEETRRVRKDQLGLLKRRMILCTECGKKSRLSSWTFVQDMYYVRPFSCVGGDYWKRRDTSKCHIICPKCEEEAYIYNHPNRDKIVSLIEEHPFSTRKLFNEVIKREIK